MDKKLQGTESFLASQDKEFQKKMDFTKSQGKFFEIVLSAIEDQTQRYRFIVDSFYQSAVQLPSLYKKGAPAKEVSQETREWLKLSMLRSIKQPLSQAQMRDACESIESNAVADINAIPEHKYTVIDFAEGSQNWDEQVFTLNSMVLGIRILGDDVPVNYDFSKGDRLDAVVYIRSEGQAAQAFLRAKGADSKEYFFELEEFSILYHTCDNEDIDENQNDANATQESDAPGIENEKATGEVGIFTLFNRKQNLLFITTY